jgi:hypothetical protein
MSDGQANKSLQATPDGVSNSAVADNTISPACLSLNIRPLHAMTQNHNMKGRIR